MTIRALEGPQSAKECEKVYRRQWDSNPRQKVSGRCRESALDRSATRITVNAWSN